MATSGEGANSESRDRALERLYEMIGTVVSDRDGGGAEALRRRIRRVVDEGPGPERPQRPPEV